MTDAQRGHRWTGAVCLVLASSTGGVGQHVTSVVRGLSAAGATVTVAGPAATEKQFRFTAAGARFVPVEIPPNPTINDRRAVGALRAALAGEVDVVHAHGLRAGLVAVLAKPRQPLVVTWHNAVLARRLRGYASRLAERVVARNADVCLGASEDLVERARRSAPGTPGSRRSPRPNCPSRAAAGPPSAPSSACTATRPWCSRSAGCTRRSATTCWSRPPHAGGTSGPSRPCWSPAPGPPTCRWPP